jgi:tRNA-specific 2-thiouridylase
MCNKFVKFGAFYKWARAQGADYIATGHYAKHNGVSLMKSEDENKDQTYFLWTLSKEIIAHVLFPVGNIEKSRVREIARESNLPVAEKKDSQGLCFVGTIDVKTLLKTYIKEREGNVLNEEGEVIGYHNGVTFYTIGERHGFTITKKGIDEKPYFIVAKDLEANSLTVSHTKKEEAEGDVIQLEKINWTEDIVAGKIYEGRARYRAPLSQLEAVDEKTFRVISGEIVSTKGQSLVLYGGARCIGGGIII